MYRERTLNVYVDFIRMAIRGKVGIREAADRIERMDINIIGNWRRGRDFKNPKEADDYRFLNIYYDIAFTGHLDVSDLWDAFSYYCRKNGLDDLIDMPEERFLCEFKNALKEERIKFTEYEETYDDFPSNCFNYNEPLIYCSHHFSRIELNNEYRKRVEKIKQKWRIKNKEEPEDDWVIPDLV
jgi:hypothetical protein